jgi:hypothetical protein
MMSYVANNPRGKICKSRCFIVPNHVEPGMYRVSWFGIYEMNTFNHVIKTVQSDLVRVK